MKSPDVKKSPKYSSLLQVGPSLKNLYNAQNLRWGDFLRLRIMRIGPLSYILAARQLILGHFNR
jgi:hypothetical protein